MAKKSNQARFPVARIKKLIQADEDVGKVAQGTPVVVSKALELFLASLVAECVKDATERGSKKITAYGLKRTIQATPEFDFCIDIVAGVADPITDEVGEDGQPLKKKRAPRKPKAKDGDDDDAAAAAAGDDAPKPKRKRAPAKPKVAKAADDDAPAESESAEPAAADEPPAEDTPEPTGAAKVPGEEDYTEDEDEPMDD